MPSKKVLIALVVMGAGMFAYYHFFHSIADPVYAPPAPAKVAGWPPLRLSAVLSTEDEWSCLINGEVLLAGESIAGVRIVEIKEFSVVVEHDGEQRTLFISGK